MSETHLQAAYDAAVSARRVVHERIVSAEAELSRLHEQEEEAYFAVIRAKQALEWARNPHLQGERP